MNVTLERQEKVWRGRGKPRKTIPPEIQKLADDTYNTGRVGVAEFSDSEEVEARELVSLLRSYANSIGKRMRIQEEGNTVRWKMVDKRAYNRTEKP